MPIVVLPVFALRSFTIDSSERSKFPLKFCEGELKRMPAQGIDPNATSVGVLRERVSILQCRAQVASIFGFGHYPVNNQVGNVSQCYKLRHLVQGKE
jgi:hypothetical protein